MKDIFKVTVEIKKEEESFELLFDDQNRAERFIYALKHVMNVKGRNNVKFSCETVELITCDEDVIKDIELAFN